MAADTVFEVGILNGQEHFQQSIQTSAFSMGSAADPQRNQVVIRDALVSPCQCNLLVVERDGEIRLSIRNHGHSLVLGDGQRMHRGVSLELALPVYLKAGDTHIQICQPPAATELDSALRRLPVFGVAESEELKLQPEITYSPSPETLTSWFESLGQIQRSTAGHSDFFKLAARCVFNPGGLDGCLVLRRCGDEWKIVAQYIPNPEYGFCYRRELVEQVAQHRRAVFHETLPRTAMENRSVHAAVVCPVIDNESRVVAVVYGFRSCHRNNNRNGIRPLEARYVGLVADSIAAGIIRLDREADCARKRVLLQQAFSPEVAEQLEMDTEFLKGTRRDVTVLFADLRNFCQISENIGASLTYQLLTDVMDRFTQIVHEHGGVVIDYFGDGISAFWNAPVEQPNHPDLACAAALAIDAAMAQLNETWHRETGCRLRVGVGVHTGPALVGNSGSRNRLKYGPQGPTVNTAGRIEQTTKKLGVGVVVSGQTARQLSDQFVPQRLCSARLSGINSATELFQLIDAKYYSKHAEMYRAYNTALSRFESGHYSETVELLTRLENQFESEPLVDFLLTEAVRKMTGTDNISLGSPQRETETEQRNPVAGTLEATIRF